MARIKLEVKYFDKDHTISRKNVGQEEPNFKRLESNILGGHAGCWDWAIMYVNDELSHYYHHSTGADRLNKVDYFEAKNRDKVNIYIVFKNGTTRTITDKSTADLLNYFNVSVGSVQAWKNNKIIAEYKGTRIFYKS
ncbi:MAG: hypothetical protein ACRBFS_19325 [Aureispira sp.]